MRGSVGAYFAVCPIEIRDVFLAILFSYEVFCKLAKITVRVRVAKVEFAISFKAIRVLKRDYMPAASGIAAVVAVVDDYFCHLRHFRPFNLQAYRLERLIEGEHEQIQIAAQKDRETFFPSEAPARQNSAVILSESGQRLIFVL